MNQGRVMSSYRFGFVLSFGLLHVAAVLVCVLTPLTRSSVLWLVGSYVVRMFGVTGGYHRYFGHRSYKMGRAAQFAMAVLAQTSAQKGVLWWAAHHRTHHRHSDTDHDIHSPVKRGMWWSHVGWVISNEHDGYDPSLIQDFAKYPELRWLDKHHWLPTAAYALAILLIGGTQAFLWGYLVSTIVLYHFTFSINSVAHLWGSRRFVTRDGSRNNLWLALVTMGEGWHNNHHFSPGSCQQGYRWWEVDVTYWILRALSLVGLTRDLRPFRKVAS